MRNTRHQLLFPPWQWFFLLDRRRPKMHLVKSSRGCSLHPLDTRVRRMPEVRAFWFHCVRPDDTSIRPTSYDPIFGSAQYDFACEFMQSALYAWSVGLFLPTSVKTAPTYAPSLMGEARPTPTHAAFIRRSSSHGSREASACCGDGCFFLIFRNPLRTQS